MTDLAATAARPAPFTVELGLRLVAFLALVAATAIHLAVIGPHLSEWAPEGAFFAALAVAQGVLAVAVLLRPTRQVAWSAIVVSLGAAGLWALSRSVGVPLGPSAGEAEAIGVADSISTAVELATAALALFWVARRPHGGLAAWLGSPVADRRFLALIVAAGVATGALGIAGVADGLGHADGGHAHAHA